MQVVLAVDKFKGTFSAQQVCEMLAEGIHHHNHKIELIYRPMADGGEGTAHILAAANGMAAMKVEGIDLLGRPCSASLYWQNSRRLAVIESSLLLGSSHAPANENTLQKSSSLGLGKIIKTALSLRPAEIWVGVGGTLTADAGWGIASAFGLRAFSEDGSLLEPCLENMAKITSLTLEPTNELLKKTKIISLCDVSAPMLGSFVTLKSFLPQKGATADSVDGIVKSLTTFWGHLKELNKNIPHIEDSFTGAGGGMCLGMASVFPNFDMELGAPRVARAIALGASLRDAGLVIAGEGALDDQSVFGKAVSTVSTLAREYDVPMVVVTGQADGCTDDILKQLNIKKVFSLFQEKTTINNEVIKQSRQRFYEIGIEIAKFAETLKLRKP